MQTQNEEIKGQLRQAILSGKTQHMVLRNSLDTITARAFVRRLAEATGYSSMGQAQLSAAVFQIAQDIIASGGRGQVIIAWRQDDSRHRGLTVFCNGYGLKPAQWFDVDQPHYLSLRRLVDEVQIANDTYNNGITLVKWIT